MASLCVTTRQASQACMQESTAQWAARRRLFITRREGAHLWLLSGATGANRRVRKRRRTGKTSGMRRPPRPPKARSNRDSNRRPKSRPKSPTGDFGGRRSARPKSEVRSTILRNGLRIVGGQQTKVGASGQSAKQAGVSFCGSSGKLAHKLFFGGQYATGILSAGKPLSRQ